MIEVVKSLKSLKSLKPLKDFVAEHPVDRDRVEAHNGRLPAEVVCMNPHSHGELHIERPALRARMLSVALPETV